MAIAFVQANDAGDGDALSQTQTCVCAYLSPNTAGNTLIALAAPSGNVAAQTIADTRGNVWTAIARIGVGWQLGVYICINCKGGANTVTTTTPQPTNFNQLTILEYSGVGAVGTPITGNGNGIATVVMTPSPTTITLSKTGSVVIECTAAGGQSGSPTMFNGAFRRFGTICLPPDVAEFAAGNQGTVITPTETLLNGGNTWSFAAFELIPFTDNTKTHTIDATAQVDSSKTFSIDATPRVDLSRSFNIDTNVRADTSKTYSADADVKQDGSDTYSIDALVLTDSFKTYSIDAVGSRPGIIIIENPIFEKTQARTLVVTVKG